MKNIVFGNKLPIPVLGKFTSFFAELNNEIPIKRRLSFSLKNLVLVLELSLTYLKSIITQEKIFCWYFDNSLDGTNKEKYSYIPEKFIIFFDTHILLGKPNIKYFLV